RVRFLARTGGAGLFLTANEAVLSLSSPPRTPGAGRSGALEERKNARRADRFRCSSLPLLHSAALSASSATSAVKPGSNAVVRMQRVGARRDARVEGVE